MIRINRKILPDLAKFIEMRYGVSLLDEEVNPELMPALLRLQYQIDETILDNYFGYDSSSGGTEGYWKQQLSYDTRRTGAELVNRLKEMGDKTEILDVGCGDNKMKELIGDNVFGIDPFNNNADAKIGVMDIKRNTGKWDVVLCLGSINFGDEATIRSQVIHVVNQIKPGGRIFWRCNPGITHGHDRAKWIDFFPWTHEFMDSLAAEYKCDVIENGWDHPADFEDIRWGNRLYSEWQKPEVTSLAT